MDIVALIVHFAEDVELRCPLMANTSLQLNNVTLTYAKIDRKLPVAAREVFGFVWCPVLGPTGCVPYIHTLGTVHLKDNNQTP